ncbi:MAG: 50S ribosomal protein L24 [Bacteroidota bacterium]
MQKKLKIRKNDIVKVISGNSKGKQGKVLSIDRKKNRAIVEGVNQVSRHTKPNAKNTQGGIVKKEAPIHVSNLMLVEGSEAVRIGRKRDEESGRLVRYSKKSNEVIK